MQRILLIQLRQLGDIILTTPCIWALRQSFPQAKIDFLAHSMGRLILSDNPYIDEQMYYSEADGLGQSIDLIRRLRQNRYDLAIDFMYNPRSALLCRLSGAKRRLAFPSRRRWAYTELAVQSKETDYIVREKFQLLQHIGLEPRDESLLLPWGDGDLGPYRQLIADQSLDPQRRRIILSPTHRREDRRWPLERYAELADLLVRQWNAHVIWIWGPGERDFVTGVMARCQEEGHLAPETRFKELAALIANCDGFIGNSNGPSHVAVACQTPSMQLHGPTLAKAWCPMNGVHLAVQGGRMEDISTDSVWARLQSLDREIEKRLQERRRNGDRMSWKFSQSMQDENRED